MKAPPLHWPRQLALLPALQPRTPAPPPGNLPARQPAPPAPPLVWPSSARSCPVQAKPAGPRPGVRTAPGPPPLRWPAAPPAGRTVQPYVPARPARGLVFQPDRGVIQRVISDSTWQSTHKGTILLDSGSEATVLLTHPVNSKINATVTEKDLFHFCTGHTVKYFSFEEDNITRSAASTFWPAGTSKSGVLALADAVLGTLHDDIEEAMKYGSTLSLRSHMHNGIKYALVITTDPGVSTDEEGLYDSGTARLTKFYPLSGTGVESADQEELRRVRALLGG